jgi:2,4-dienoyl-CoA reductase-like NADH-dependent reductase (Old Yellow Enzyme family)
MAHHPQLLLPLLIKSISIKNRIWMSPMCQYSSVDGHPTDWHVIHLGSRAVGGAGLIMVEATAVSPEGRISASDSGIWSDTHIASFKPITQFLKAQGATPGIQLAHAGRKGAAIIPWGPDKSTWQTVAPSAIPFDAGDATPKALSQDEMQIILSDFTAAARRSLLAGFQVLELHIAHGYLLHQYLSPLSNTREDEYGGSLENRMRFPLAIVKAVREAWPAELPLFVRISATDWADGRQESDINETNSIDHTSWRLADTLLFCHELKQLGVDLIDCSSGGTLPHADIPVGPGYQTPFAATIRTTCKLLTAAVGMITEPAQAEAILIQQQADAVFIGRELLRDPYWPLRAAKYFGIDIARPNQYGRA